MRRSSADFDDVFGEEPNDGDELDEHEHLATSSTGDQVDQVDQVMLEEATRRVAVAIDAVEAAQESHRAAEDLLADAEGVVAVLEIKLTDVAAEHTNQTGRTAGAEGWQVAAVREELAAARRRYVAAGQGVGTSQARLESAETQLAAAQEAHAVALQTPAAPEPEQVEAPRFASLPLFVEQFVLPNWVHHLGENYAGRWCRQWWEHAEALTRLEAVWEAFEVMRREPAPSFSTWLRDHLDPHMRSLSDPNGAFYRCDAEKGVHEAAEAWPTMPAPEGMFAVIPGAVIQPKTDESASADPADQDDSPTPTRTREMQHG